MLSVFHNRRWDVDYLTVRDAIGSGSFGKLINLESRLGQFSSCVGPAAKEYHPNWRNEASFGGGGLYDWGSHFVDQIWRILLPARPMRVFAQLSKGGHVQMPLQKTFWTKHFGMCVDRFGTPWMVSAE